MTRSPLASVFIIGSTVGAFITLLLLAHTAYPEIRLSLAGAVLALALCLSAWTVHSVAEDGSDLLRVAQFCYGCVPFVWAFWVASNEYLLLEPRTILLLAAVVCVSIAVQEIGFMKGAHERRLSASMSEATHSVEALPESVDTGSTRILVEDLTNV